MEPYRALHNCIITSPDWAGYPGTLSSILQYANEEIDKLLDLIPAKDVWDSVLSNSDYSGLSDEEKDKLKFSLLIYSWRGDGIETASGSAVRDYIVSIFGAQSDTVQDLVSKFTIQVRRALTYGWSGIVEDVDIIEAVNRFGGP